MQEVIDFGRLIEDAFAKPQHDHEEYVRNFDAQQSMLNARRDACIAVFKTLTATRPVIHEYEDQIYYDQVRVYKPLSLGNFLADDGQETRKVFIVPQTSRLKIDTSNGMKGDMVYLLRLHALPPDITPENFEDLLQTPKGMFDGATATGGTWHVTTSNYHPYSGSDRQSLDGFEQLLNTL